MVHKLCHVLRNDSDSPTRNSTLWGVDLQCKGQPVDLHCSWAAHLSRQKCVRGPQCPCVKASCVIRAEKFHLGEACSSRWAPSASEEHIQARLKDSAEGEFVPHPVNCPSGCLFIRAVKKWPFCFPVHVKLSAYCCKSFEFYFCGQALAIFLSPVAFFPPLTLSAASWEQLDPVTRNVQVPDTGTEVTSVMLVAAELAGELLCRQQGRDWDLGRRAAKLRESWVMLSVTYVQFKLVLAVM